MCTHVHTEWVSFTHLYVDKHHYNMHLAKIKAQCFMLEDFYLEIFAEFNIVVNDHYHNNYNMHNIILLIKLCALL